MHKTLLAGFNILIIALILNWLASLLGLATWYDVVQSLGRVPIGQLLRSYSILEWGFLLIIYPYALGFAGLHGRH